MMHFHLICKIELNHKRITTYLSYQIYTVKRRDHDRDCCHWPKYTYRGMHEVHSIQTESGNLKTRKIKFFFLIVSSQASKL